MSVLLLSCGDKKKLRRLSGNWTLVSLTATDKWGFTKECNATGSMTFNDCCDYNANISSTSDFGSYNRDDSGSYSIVNEHTEIRFIRTSLPSADTIDAHIYLLTRDELKIMYKEPDTQISYLAIFNKD